jgi:hypothetical protein
VVATSGTIAHPPLGHHGDALEHALPDLRRAGLDGGTHIVDAPADEILHQRPLAAIGDMGDVGADRHVEEHAG